MKVGIIGPSGCGKTTLFNALTGMEAPTGAGRKTHLAVVKVPDERLDKLSELTGNHKIVPAEVNFSDVGGGLGKPTRERGMEPKLINMMSAMDVFAIVVADFKEYVRPGGGQSDPLTDVRDLCDDLMLTDMVIIEGKLERVAKENISGIERAALEKCRDHLEKEIPLRILELTRDEQKAVSNYGFLSLKSNILIRNAGENKITQPEPEGIEEFAKSRNLTYMSVAAKLQMDIAQMDPDERDEFVEAMGLKGVVLSRFIRAAFDALDLICFFTVGGPSKETHAWTIKRDATAVEAAGRIHSDIQRGFIRAEVAAYDDYIACGGESGAKQAGKIRLEGKDYVVKDGDVIYFRFNV